jgi:hypothetical protein
MKLQFENGYALGWKMAVPKAFEGSIKDKNIDPGEIFYDTHKAYELPWGEAIRHIRVFVQVDQVRADEISFTIRVPNSSRTDMVTLRAATLPVSEFIHRLEHGFETED